MSDVHDVLVKARNLISDPKDWAQGYGLFYTGANPNRLCAHGAVNEACPRNASAVSSAVSGAFAVLTEVVGCERLAPWKPVA